MSILVFRRPRAFTLIELLIVVAIIAILAAIAVPNFLEAQTRAKVSRAKSDLRTISTGLETYRIDANNYPASNLSSRVFLPPSKTPADSRYDYTLERLTTPIAYLTGAASFGDPFKAVAVYQGATLDNENPIAAYDNADFDNFQYYWYVAREGEPGGSVIWDDNVVYGHPNKVKWYALMSAGPDGRQHTLGTALNTMTDESADEYALSGKIIYDPTNGTISRGSVVRVGGEPVQNGVAFFRMAERAK